jgi:uncharacterized protein with HXXEE motif
MITRKLQRLTLLASILLIAHGIEEWTTGLFREDPIFQAALRFPGGAPEASFVFFQFMVGICLILLLATIHSERWRLRVLMGFGVVLAAEIQHIFFAFQHLRYEPGLVTSIGIVIVAIFYWRELLLARRSPTASR